MTKRFQHEKNVSTPQQVPQADPRLPLPHGDARRTQDDQSPPRQRSRPHHHLRRRRRGIPKLRKNREFQLVFGRGRNQVGRTLVVHALRSRYRETRLGISVSKKLGGAVVRNRVRRVLTEICRQVWPRMRGHHDVVLVARKGLEACNFVEMQVAVLELLQRARLLEEPKHEAAPPGSHPPVPEVLKTDPPGLPL